MQGKKHYQPKLFATFNLADKIPDHNVYRVLKQVLDLRFLRAQTKKYYGKSGQKSLDPEVFFKMILVGYLENINSDRRLVEHCAMRLDIRYFLDYDIDEALPWHSTLSRTRQLYSQQVFREVFKKVLQLCIDKGMVAGRRQAIDSALIKANASMDSLKRREILEDADNYVQELEKNQSTDQPAADKEDQKPDEPPTLGSHYAQKKLDNQTHYSASDPDAKISVKPGKPRRLNYLSQVSVDTANHVICHIQADLADKKDSQCLAQVVEKTKENLTPHGLRIAQVLCDGNYSSAEVLKNLARQRISGYIPNFGSYKPHREGFTYLPSEDCYVCSQGVVLPFKGIKRSSRGDYAKEYRSSSKDCKQCALREKCIGKSQHKQIKDSVDKPYFDHMHHKMQTPYGRYSKKLRQITAEPVIGSLIENQGMRKIRTKGIYQANKCMLMAATAYNLNKWLKYPTGKVKTVAMAVKNALQLIFNHLLSYYYPIKLNYSYAENFSHK